MKGAAAVLAAYGTVEAIPTDAAQWTVKVRGAAALAETLATSKKAALLYKKLATLRTDVPLTETLADIEYLGAEQAALAAICEEIEERSLMERITRWRP
jgi:5'-3' exonuclease